MKAEIKRVRGDLNRLRAPSEVIPYDNIAVFEELRGAVDPVIGGYAHIFHFVHGTPPEAVEWAPEWEMFFARLLSGTSSRGRSGLHLESAVSAERLVAEALGLAPAGLAARAGPTTPTVGEVGARNG